MIPFLAELEPVTFSSTLGGQILATDFFTEGLLRISSMLKGVKGLLELAGGGSWSRGARLLSSGPLDCNTEPAFMSLLEVIAVPKESPLSTQTVDYFIQNHASSEVSFCVVAEKVERYLPHSLVRLRAFLQNNHSSGAESQRQPDCGCFPSSESRGSSAKLHVDL